MSMPRDGMSQVPFDRAQLLVFLGRREARGAAARLRARGSSDPMDVVLSRVEQIEVHHMDDLGHVDPARRDVGGDQHAIATAPEAVERLAALRHRAICVQARHPVAGRAHRARHAIGAMLGAREDERLTTFLAEEPEQERRLLLGRRLVEHLRDFRDGLGDHAGVDAHGTDEMPADQRLDLCRHRRRKAEGLPVERRYAEDALDLGCEAHVEHAVGLVEDDDAERAEAKRPALEVIEEPAGGRNNDVGSPLEPGELRPHRFAPDEDDRLDALGAAEHVERLRGLQSELARRREYERARSRAAVLREPRVRPDQEFDSRNREGGGLAGARLGAADQVASLEDRPDRLGLDRSGSGIARAGDSLAHREREPRISECAEHEMESLSCGLCVGHPGPLPGPGGSEQGRLLYLLDVGCLKTLRTASYFELDPVTLSKALETLGLDGAVVDEHVLAALLCDEPVTLRIVEPLHLSLSHTSNLSLGGLQAPCSRHRGGVASRNWKANKNAARTGPARRVSRSSQSLPDSVCARTEA